MRAPAAALAALLLLGARAEAHDTWLEPRPDTERGERVFALGTGTQFPALQTPIPVELLQRPVCLPLHDAGRRPWPLRWMADTERATLLRSTRGVPAGALLDCSVAMAPLPIALTPDAAAAHLDEVRADATARARWRELEARGIAWNERFSKHARLLHGAAPLAGPVSAGAIDDAMPLDVLLTLPRWPLRAGDVLQGQLLRDGQPLAGHAIELRNDLSPVGLWRRTDAEGRFALPLPLAARWLLRTIDLRPAGDAWESRFFSVGFEVLAPR